MDERPRPVLPTPEQLRRLAQQLRAVTVKQSMRPLERVIPEPVRATLAACVEEVARVRQDPALARERRLQERADDLAILATSRRLPIEAVDALIRAADQAGRTVLPVNDVRRALLRTEADFER